MSLKFNLLIGVESHIKISFFKKLFFFLKNKNNNICNNNNDNFNLSLPGVLPIFNFNILNKIILLGFFLKSDIYYISFFFRKNYFYPDIAKNYQITQYNYSILKNGYILIYNNYVFFPYYKIINIKQIHLEEDTGKINYFLKKIKLNYNRSGNVLIEIVTFPIINDFYESYLYINNLIYLLKFLELSECNLQNGDFRFDFNISIKNLYIKNNFKIELKNINLLSFILNLIKYEFKRLLFIYINGDFLISQTRGYNNILNNTFLIRVKENYLNYKYFLEPDLIYILLNKNIFNNFFLINFFYFFKIFKINLNYFINILYFIFFKKIFYFFLLLGFFYLNFLFILNWLFNLFSLNIKIIYFSFEQLFIILNILLYNYISINLSKKIFFFLNKKKIINIFFLYKFLNFNKILFINFDFSFIFNNFIISNLFILHNYIFNKKIINKFNHYFLNNNINYYSFFSYFNKKIFIFREMDEWFKSRN